MSNPKLRVGVFGAGAIGGFLGLSLSAAGAPVVLFGRRSLVDGRDRLAARPAAGEWLVPGADLVVTDRAADLASVDLCLVTVKSADTDAAAAALADVLRPDAVVVSFQNGLHNAERLRARLSQPVSQGIVTFNVVREEPLRFRQASVRPMYAGALPGAPGERLQALRDGFTQGGLRLDLRADIEAVAAGKLLVNLNNGVCAATGLGIVASLESRDARWCFARCIQEGLRVMRDAGLRPVSVTGIPPLMLAKVLALPDQLVLPMARQMMAIDPAARSSTLQDLDRGRATEIDDLNGEVVRLARAAGRAAPVNGLVVELVHRHERRATQGHAPDYLTPAELRSELRARLRRRNDEPLPHGAEQP